MSTLDEDDEEYEEDECEDEETEEEDEAEDADVLKSSHSRIVSIDDAQALYPQPSAQDLSPQPDVVYEVPAGEKLPQGIRAAEPCELPGCIPFTKKGKSKRKGGACCIW